LRKSAIPESSGGRFPETHWSVIREAGGPRTPTAEQALDTLCNLYWYPIYAYIRRKGNNANQSLDLTQEFFYRLLKKGGLESADPSKGRFRAFLLTACKNFLIDMFRHDQAASNQPAKPILSIDAGTAERRYLKEPGHVDTPERIYERQWARTLLERVLNRLREDYDKAGKKLRFEQLKVVLTEPARSIPYAEIASRLGTTEDAVAVAVHRLRQRYRTILREEILATLADPADVDDEIQALFKALAS
jgi:RNA polymerase sigma factor (sigma-70 family)